MNTAAETASPDPNLLRVPPSAEMDPERRKVLVGAAKMLLGRFQKLEMMPVGKSYQDILNSPALLQKFMRAFRENRHLSNDLVLDKAGRPLAPDDLTTPLVCGPSLEQIEKLLVYTCATKVFGEGPTRVHQEQTLSILEKLKLYLAFEWQLPLLEGYKAMLSYAHVRYIDREILLLRTPAALGAVGHCTPIEIDLARKLAKDRFAEMVAAAPGAVGGLSSCKSPDDIAKMEQVVGKRVWEFFARDRQFVVEALAVRPQILEAIGPVLVDLSVEALHEVQTLPIEILRPFLAVLPSVFGKEVGLLLKEPDFCRDFMRPVVAAFRGMRVSEAQKRDLANVIADAATLKWGANMDRIKAWRTQRGF